MVGRLVALVSTIAAIAVAAGPPRPTLAAQRVLPTGEVRFEPKGEIFTLTFEDGTTCTVSIEMWVNGSWLLPILVNGQQGTAVFREGTPAPRTQDVTDRIAQYATIVKDTFRDSRDMQAKVRRGCDSRHECHQHASRAKPAHRSRDPCPSASRRSRT